MYSRIKKTTQFSYNSECLDQGGDSYNCISALTTFLFKPIHIFRELILSIFKAI